MSDRTLFRRSLGVLVAFGFMLSLVVLGYDAVLRQMGEPGFFLWSIL